MKILFFISSLSGGGAERVTSTLANFWVAKGWAVTVVTVAGAGKDFYTLDSRVRRVEMNLAVRSRHLGQAVFNNLRRVVALRRILRQVKPDAAVAMMSSANAILAIAGRLAGVPTVGSERIHPPSLPLGKFWELVRRWTYPFLHVLVAQTGDSAIWLQKHAPAKRIVVIPNPIQFPLAMHPPRVAPERLMASLPGNKILLAVGRLEQQKGFERLITAFAGVTSRHPDWSLVILGRGVLHDSLVQQCEGLGIGGRVALPDMVGNVGEWYEAADLFAMTSRFEGFPNTLLEALACGLPAVAVDCKTGPRDIVRHEVDGLLVPQDDSDALEGALEQMMSDESLRKRFSARAVEVRERFAVERIANQWEALFEHV